MIDRILDPYDRKARLYPALLVTLVPVVATTLVAPVFSSQLAGLASLAIALGGLMLLSSLGREWGETQRAETVRELGRHSDDADVVARDNSVGSPDL